jgi:two-component system sensor histidine kinase ChiS
MKRVFGWPRAQIILCLGAFLLILLSCLLFNTAPSQAKSLTTTDLAPIEITEGWQYRWGDSPLDETGVPIWTKEEISSPGWQAFQFPKKLRKPPGEKIVWLRVSLPKGQWQSPMLYLRAVPCILEAYLENKPIYKQFSLNASGEANYEDYQWPIVPLQQGFQGKTLFFRVYAGNSFSIYIGLFDRVTLGSQTDLIKRLIQQEIDAILGVFFTFLGLIASFLSFESSRKKSLSFFWIFGNFSWHIYNR